MTLDEALTYAEGVRRPGAESEPELVVLALAAEIDRLRTEPPRIADLRVELIRALEFWRWCWDCGTTDRDCRTEGRPCCPDCRHRDMGNLALAAILAPRTAS